MSADAWAGVAVAVLALAWAVTTWVLGRALSRARSEGALEAEVRAMRRDLARIAGDKDRVHAELLAQMRDDRASADTRLRWLETNLWLHRQGTREQ